MSKKSDAQSRVDGLPDALDKAASQDSPTLALAAAWTHAPSDGIRDYLDNIALEVLMVDLPKLQMVMHHGPTIAREGDGGMTGIGTAFATAIADIEKTAPGVVSSLSMTVRSAGEDIAAAIDKAISRVLLDAPVSNRLAYLDLLQQHSKIVKALSELEITPEQQAEIDEHLGKA